MIAGGTSSLLKIKGALMEKYVKSQTKKYQSPQLQAGDLLCFEKLSTYTGLIKKY